MKLFNKIRDLTAKTEPKPEPKEEARKEALRIQELEARVAPMAIWGE
jgi:hypothetical protein